MRAAAVIGATAIVLASSCTWQLSLFIPDGVPPPAGDPVPPVDTHASGRPADQLHDCCAARGRIGDPGHRARGLRIRGAGRRGREPEVPHRLDHAGRHRAGREPPRHLPRRAAGAQRRCEPPIRGVRLDGSGGTLRIVDNDEDVTDEDGVTRAMGPMQFIPETWRLYAVDAHNDGRVSPDNIDDAALAAAGYLCWRGKDLATPRGGSPRCAPTTTPVSTPGRCAIGRPLTPKVTRCSRMYR